MAASDRMVLGPLVGSIDQGTSSSRFLVRASRSSGCGRAGGGGFSAASRGVSLRPWGTSEGLRRAGAAGGWV